MNEMDRSVVGAIVAKARKQRGWSKEKAAQAAGITTTTLRRIEDGLRVQDAKLELILLALDINLDGPVAQDDYPEEQMAPSVFILPPEIERGYTETVAFSRAVSEHAPDLAQRATRLMIDAAGLFADAGDIILQREGGDGHADDTRGAAPMRLLSEHEVDRAAYDPEADQSTDD